MTTRMKRLAVGLSVVLLLAVAGAAYVRVGWWRMEAACSADPPGATRATASVATGWSWSPPGFRCTYADGRDDTSLWP